MNRFLPVLAIVINLDDCSCGPQLPKQPPEVEAGTVAAPDAGVKAGFCNCHVCGSIVPELFGLIARHNDPLGGGDCLGSFSTCQSPAALPDEEAQ